ncbi:helix-turn-helix transcriptional regulator [Nocardia goodfellowii]|uniref:Transcriptional regulator with XRE-family HTH domain n=1 Tax=Nocardia goodfellowii TaxID=882446 RepID=A0ABS4QH29_9NOCA|nr:transcriptional regulator with XRE-family HTH domain [Nocardia goodfellowii]
MGISQSKLSRIETGTTVPSVPQVQAWCAEVDASPEIHAALRQLTEAAHSEVSTWRSALQTRDHLQDDVADQEAEARLIRNFQPSLVPGLLQTAEYARRVFEKFQLTYTRERLAAATAARLHRQLALFDPERPFEFLITEAALRLRPGPHRILLAQLDRIASISTLDNVSVGLIPQDVEATTTIPHGFVIYEYGDSALVSTEMVDASRFIREPKEVELYRGRWNLLRQMAVFDDEARDFLKALAIEIRRSVDG